jgi:hypothetical protein
VHGAGHRAAFVGRTAETTDELDQFSRRLGAIGRAALEDLLELRRIDLLRANAEAVYSPSREVSSRSFSTLTTSSVVAVSAVFVKLAMS